MLEEESFVLVPSFGHGFVLKLLFFPFWVTFGWLQNVGERDERKKI